MVSAEVSPLASTGGLGEAVAGLTAALRRRPGVTVDLVMPDYGGVELAEESSEELLVPDWAGWARVRSGRHPEVGPIDLVAVPEMARPHPYADPATGAGWWDNDRRFFAFCAAVAELVRRRSPDVVHVNDWHTCATLTLSDPLPPSVLTIHNLAFAGNADAGWQAVLGPHAGAAVKYDQVLPLVAGLRLAGRIVAVSPNYAHEILTSDELSMGLGDELAARAADVRGILNGIDTTVWDPAVDPHLVSRYSADRPQGRGRNAAALRRDLALDPTPEVPLLGAVTRFTEQKGVDAMLGLEPYLATLPAQMVILGSGDPGTAAWAQQVAERNPGRVALVDRYDPAMAHRIFAAADVYLMPSRFEPCGLAQMQAMRYGALPVVTDVGGLHDTVTDDDLTGEGNGIVAVQPPMAGWVDAVHRAVRAWRDPKRRAAIRRRGMSHDWSWDGPAGNYLELYREVG